MKAIITMFVLVIVINSCTQSGSEKTKPEVDMYGTLIDIDENNKVIIIDSCEYLITARNTNSQSVTHKGNCKNPIHKQ